MAVWCIWMSGGHGAERCGGLDLARVCVSTPVDRGQEAGRRRGNAGSQTTDGAGVVMVRLQGILRCVCCGSS